MADVVVKLLMAGGAGRGVEEGLAVSIAQEAQVLEAAKSVCIVK